MLLQWFFFSLRGSPPPVFCGGAGVGGKFFLALVLSGHRGWPCASNSGRPQFQGRSCIWASVLMRRSYWRGCGRINSRGLPLGRASIVVTSLRCFAGPGSRSGHFHTNDRRPLSVAGIVRAASRHIATRALNVRVCTAVQQGPADYRAFHRVAVVSQYPDTSMSGAGNRVSVICKQAQCQAAVEGQHVGARSPALLMCG